MSHVITYKFLMPNDRSKESIIMDIVQCIQCVHNCNQCTNTEKLLLARDMSQL